MGNRMHDIKSIIESNSLNLAFIIGNGINFNAFNGRGMALGWENILINLWNICMMPKIEDNKIPIGITYTEFYELIAQRVDEKILKQKIIDIINNPRFAPNDRHKAFLKFARELNVPVLTTNYDNKLAENSHKIIIRRKNDYGVQHGRNFTRLYPWDVVYTTLDTRQKRYSDSELMEIMNGFGIWHINGMIDYPSSLKLSLSEYTRLAKRALDYINSAVENIPEAKYMSKQSLGWDGANTWLHHIFNRDLFIFGLGLDEQETFLRWILLKRQEYNLKYRNCQLRGWYLTCEKETKQFPGKKLFLEYLGIKTISVKDYIEMYDWY